MDCSAPSRMTRARDTDILRSAASDRSARNSCTNPSTPLKNTMARIAAASIQSSNKPETMAAPISTHTIRLANWERKSFSKEGGGASGNSLGPSCANRRAAASIGRPQLRSVWSSSASASAGRAYQALAFTLPFVTCDVLSIRLVPLNSQQGACQAECMLGGIFLLFAVA